jgi:all-trans-retinol 13,14-reductase
MASRHCREIGEVAEVYDVGRASAPTGVQSRMMIRIGQSYRKRPPEGEYDVIVIGSGVGGLTVAALLAKHSGKRVLVLERHYMPGGFTHVFSRRGYEWDVGVHYIGGVGDRRSATRRLFDHITDGSLEWASMGDVYDRIILGENAYDYVAGPEAFAGRMKEYFPGEESAIDRYLDLTRQAKRWSGLYFAEKAVPSPIAAIAGGLMRSQFLRHARRTTRSVLDELTSNAELKGVLTGQFGDYGLPPGRSSFGMHALLVRHYLRGGFYPVGGSSAIAAAMAPTIEEAGGEVHFQAEVSEILVRDGRAVGVRMADDRRLEAPVIVSDAGVHNTFLRLLPQEVGDRHESVAKAVETPYSVAHLCLYAGFKRTAAELGLPKTNLWIYPGPDHDANVEAFVADPQAPLPVVYVSFPAAKDPSFETSHPGRATIELITLAPYDRFAPWAGTAWRKRGEEYEALKSGLAERMLSQLERQLPGLTAQIDHMEISTPLSTRHFAAYEHGEIYGLDHSPARFENRALRPRTTVPGLYLTGQDVVSCGVAGAMAGGYLAGSAILGKNLLRSI